jgi:DNA repair exonuclease SbcCD nuclease subunit
MARPLHEIQWLKEKYEVPVLCAGDIFDHWRSPPELINFALEHLPEMYAVPGQHDMPLHSMDDIKKSAFWTLVEAKKVFLVTLGTTVGGVWIGGAEWGGELPGVFAGTEIKVALLHAYAWIQGKSYPGAPEANELGSYRKMLKGYDVAIFGDNHKGFLAECGKTQVMNCGTLMRRKSDEIKYRPQVGLLLSTGKIIPYRLDTQDDKIEVTEAVKKAEVDTDLEQFLQGLTQLQNSRLDFVEAMKQVLEDRKPPRLVREMILEAMDAKEV